MTATKSILLEAMRRQIRLTPGTGENFRYEFVKQPDAEFLEILRVNKSELLKLLRSKRHLAKQVLAGEFTGADEKTFHHVHTELSENVFDPVCRAAIEYLKKTLRTQQHR